MSEELNIDTTSDPGNDWVQGFNDGYLIGLHDEALSDAMMESMQSDSSYLDGFRCGADEGGLERAEIERMEELGEFERDNDGQDLDLDRD